MSFWDLFSNKNETKKDQTSLYYKVKENFPHFNDEQLTRVTGISGLLARVAYVDFHFDPKEKIHMHKALTEMTNFTNEEITSITDLSVKYIKELAGLENHKLVHSLKEVLDRNSRYDLVQALFYLAASDGVVENIESEEIRIIVKGLDLSDKHFLAARAKVSDKLKALNIK